MKQLSEKAALALANLRASADFRMFIEFLREDEAQELERCRDHEGVALSRAQGAAKKLHDIFAAYAEAPAVTEKFRSTKRE